MRISQAVNSVAKRLKDVGIDSCHLDAQLIVATAANMTRAAVLTYPERELTAKQLNSVEEMTAERLSHKPLQYILGECEFMGLDFFVTEDTLIPRGDTEVLVEKAIELIKANSYTSALDIGTGTGAIAISVGKYTGIDVTAVDISKKALTVAVKNAQRNGVNAEFIQSDLFSHVKGSYDIIMSNPPYIESSVIPTLEPNVKDYEPILALDGGADGLDFYRRIINECTDYINKNGTIIFEIGYNQAEAVSLLLRAKNFKNVRVLKDLAGYDRVVIGFKS